MDSREELMWQRATLYRCLVANESKTVFTIVTPNDFLPGPHMTLAQILARIQDAPATAQTALAETIRLGETATSRLIPEIIAEGDQWLASGVYYAHQVAELSAKRRMTTILTRLQQNIERSSGDQLWAAVDDAQTELAAIDRKDVSPDDDAFDLEYFEALIADKRPFTVPGILAKQDRFLMVGKEGGGKSTLVYQLMTGAAYGVDTLSPTLQRYEPQRVLFLDVENSEFQIADQIKRIHGVIKEQAPDVKPVWKSLKLSLIHI